MPVNECIRPGHVTSASRHVSECQSTNVSAQVTSRQRHVTSVSASQRMYPPRSCHVSVTVTSVTRQTKPVSPSSKSPSRHRHVARPIRGPYSLFVSFGDVARLDISQGFATGLVLVTFYDVRVAQKVLKHFSPFARAGQAGADDFRAVWLTSSLLTKLPRRLIRFDRFGEVAALSSCGENIIVEFYDMRAALHAISSIPGSWPKKNGLTSSPELERLRLEAQSYVDLEEYMTMVADEMRTAAAQSPPGPTQSNHYPKQTLLLDSFLPPQKHEFKAPILGSARSQGGIAEPFGFSTSGQQLPIHCPPPIHCLSDSAVRGPMPR